MEWYAVVSQNTQGVSDVMVDGRELSRGEVRDRLWDYVDGMGGDGDPWVVRTTDEIISSLRFGVRRECDLKG